MTDTAVVRFRTELRTAGQRAMYDVRFGEDYPEPTIDVEAVSDRPDG